MKSLWWIYLLLLVPTLTEIIETGRLPTAPRELITDAVMTVCVGILVLLIHRKHRELTNMSETDELTGLKNRRAFQANLAAEVTRAHRLHSTLTLAIIDIDQFKSVNDRYGHHKGDRVLAGVGALLKDSVRSGIDTCYRIGGDEFAVLLPATGSRGVEGIDKRMNALLKQGMEFLKPWGAGLSIGIATVQNKECPEDFFKRADSHMYMEKKNNGSLGEAESKINEMNIQC
jgi:diguanylate cyclase (GGDEF)-like protein